MFFEPGNCFLLMSHLRQVAFQEPFAFMKNEVGMRVRMMSQKVMPSGRTFFTQEGGEEQKDRWVEVLLLSRLTVEGGGQHV